MGIKRKHSDEASSISISSFGTVSTLDAQSPIPCPQSDGAMDMDDASLPRSNGWDFTRAHRIKSNDWGNRTRKRVRDNRPDERSIHENTVHKLFLAQRQQPHASPIPSSLPTHEPAITVSKPQKSTLHSFWSISAPPIQAPIFSYQTAPQQDEHGPRCEDCDAHLDAENNILDVDVDMDAAAGSGPFACHDCGRNVCGTCAVVSTARHCLQCATRGY